MNVARLLKFPSRNQSGLEMDKQNFLKGSRFTDLALQTDAVQDAILEVLARLDLIYGAFQPGKDFVTHVYLPMTEATLNEPAEFTFQACADAKHTNHTFAAHMDYMLRSCAYAIEASRAADAGSHQTAWRHIANAQYYLGLLWGSLMLEPALAGFVTSRAKRAGAKRGDKYANLKNKALELAAKGKDGKPFPSRRQAAKAITPEVWELEKTLKTGISEENLYNQIYMRWLADMEFGPKG